MSRVFKTLFSTKFLKIIVILQFIFGLISPLFINSLNVRAASVLDVTNIEIDSIETNTEVEVPIQINNDSEFDWNHNIKLTYRWYQNNILIEQDLVLTDLQQEVLKENTTHPEQKIKIKSPNRIGNLVLKIDLFDINNQNYISDIYPSLLPNGKIVEVKDTQKPTQGKLTFLEGSITEKRVVNLQIEGSDNIHLSQMRIGQKPDLSDAEWETFKESKQIDLHTTGNYNFYAQFKDSSNNISDEPFASTTIEVINTLPMGSITIDKGSNDAQDNLLDIDFSNISDESNITGYRIALSPEELSLIQYKNFEPKTTIQIPEITNTYNVYAQFVDEFGNESEIILSNINYKHYNIKPQVISLTKSALFGGEFDYTFKLKNTGSDVGYNAFAELTLPDGFKYVSADRIQPSYIDNQTVRFTSFADLLPNEEVTISIKLKAPSDKYIINQEVPIEIKARLSKRVDWTSGFESSIKDSIKLLPYRISNSYSNTSRQEVLVGSQLNHKITIQSNPILATDNTDVINDPNIIYQLDSSDSYVENSFILENYSGEYVFNYGENEDGIKYLSIIFKDGLNPDHFNNPITINFRTELLSSIKHNDPYQNNLNFEATYNNQYFQDRIDEDYIAKYFQINKKGYVDDGVVNIGDTINYEVRLKVSKYYSLSGITVTDILPDGLQYIDSDQSDKLKTISVKDIDEGKTEIKWHILNISPEEEFVFSFRTKVLEQYSNLQKLLSSDILTNNISVEAVWVDNNGESGWGDDSGSDTQKTEQPLFNTAIYSINDIELINESTRYTNVMVGDSVIIKSKITFPSDTPTKDFAYKIIIPVGTQLKNLTINKNGEFEFNPDNYHQIADGYEFNLGRVEPTSTIEISYELEILDDPNLKLSTITRNLFRADYKNSNDSKFTYRDEITFNIIEPKIEITKRKITGYLASGENALIEVKLKNTGLTTAYKLNLNDTVPLNSTFVELNTNDSNCSVILVDNQFSAQNCELSPGQEITFTYTILSDSELIAGNSMHSSVLVNYQLRTDHDAKSNRYFETQKDFNWQSTEPALITNIYREDQVNSSTENLLKAGRDDSFNLVAYVSNVGGAPVYNSTIRINLNETGELANDLNNIVYTVLINGNIINKTANIINGVYEFNDFDLKPADQIKILFDLKTKRFAEFDNSYNVSIEATGFNKLNEFIRKDTSNELPADTDNDDHTNKNIIITKVHTLPPSGYILFKINNVYKQFTNQLSGDVEYYAFARKENTAITNEIIAIRFSNALPIGSDQEQNWYKLPTLPDCTLELCGTLAQSSNEWNAFAENDLPIIQSSSFSEGKNYKYMEVIDLYGNTSIIQNHIVVDTQAPIFGNVLITPEENDFTNHDSTSKFGNYIHIYAQDNDKDSQGNYLSIYDYAGIGEYIYSFDGIKYFGQNGENISDESGWEQLNEGINTIYKNFPVVNHNEELKIFIRIRDLAGNEMTQVISDTIIYTEDKPQIELKLNNDDEYTNNSLVNINLNLEDTGAGVNKYRFAKNINEINIAQWLDYTSDINQLPLINAFQSGEHSICVQVKDSAAAKSNISCDSILLDNLAPIGNISINNNLPETQSNKVILTIQASDPILSDGNPGIADIKMRISTEDLNSLDNTEGWIDLKNEISFELENIVGQASVFIQFKDLLGNVSQIYSDDILINPLTGNGTIVINNNELFTNTKNVALTLGIDLETQPAFMRFIETKENTIPSFPPTVSNWEEYQEYLDSLSDEALAQSEGWSYWEEFTSEKQWILSDEYQQKNVYVQYMFTDGTTTDMYYDSIIYAPLYGIDFYTEDNLSIYSDSSIKTYGLNRVPDEVYSQDELFIKFNAKNFGSLTWMTSGNNPVRISYRWKAIATENDSIGTPTLDEYRGSAVILPENISWNEETGELTLKVDTPVFAGKYKLIIDAIHEGITWFSTYGNETPSFIIDVLQNPDIQEPDNQGTIPEVNENVGGYPACSLISWGTRHTLIGTLQIANVNEFGVNYKIVENDGTIWLIGNNGFDPFVGQEVEIIVEFRPHSLNSSCRDFVVIKNTLKITPKTWIANWHSQNITPPDSIHLYKGDEVTLEIDYINTGTGVWNKTTTFLSTTNVNFEYPSNSASRLPLAPGYIDISKGSIAKFQFKIKAKDTTAFGSHVICFKPIHISETIQFDYQTCFKVELEMTEVEQKEFLCDQSQKIYSQASYTSTILGELNKNSKFIQLNSIIIDSEEWIKIYYENTASKVAYIQNSNNCFSNITVVENPIPKTILPVTPPPSGDTGYIIFNGDINVYDCPSEFCNIVTRLKYNDPIRVLQQTNDINGKGWLYIESTTSNVTMRGWIPKGTAIYVNNPPTANISLNPSYRQMHICGGNIIARKGPGLNYPEIVTLNENFNTNILIVWNDWYLIYIDSQGSTGWINSKSNICEGHYFVPSTYTGNISGVSFIKNLPYIFPIDSRKITSTFGNRIIGGSHDYHSGVDYIPTNRSACGTPVKAAADGYIYSTQSGYKLGGLNSSLMNKANYVVIDHPNGTRTRYWHLQDVFVTKGAYVKQGQVIGTIGNTGYSSGCHLHFEFWLDKNNSNSAVDPEKYLTIPLTQAEQSVLNFGSQKLSNRKYFGDNRDSLKSKCSYTYQEISSANIADGTNMYNGIVVNNPKIGASILVRNGIYEAYKEVDLMCGPLGAPIFTSGWLNGNKLSNHYTEVDAAVSALGTSGYVQRFENGSIYYNNKQNDGYAVYGEIERRYELAKGTNGVYGFPVDQQYYNLEKKSYCQKFEREEICISDKEYKIVNPSDLNPFKSTIEKINNDRKVTYNLAHNRAQDIEYVSEPLKSKIINEINELNKLVDFFSSNINYLSSIYHTLEFSINTAEKMLSDQVVMNNYLHTLLLQDHGPNYTNEVINFYLMNCYMSLKSSGYGCDYTKQYINYKSDPLREYKNILYDSNLIPALQLISVGGEMVICSIPILDAGCDIKYVLTGTDFTGHELEWWERGISLGAIFIPFGSSKVLHNSDELASSVKGYKTVDNLVSVKVINYLPDEAYKFIVDRGGDPGNIIGFKKINNGYTWIEVGISGSKGTGWIHILERHYPDFPASSIGKGTLFSKIPATEVKEKIFEIINNATPINSQGNLLYSMNVRFSDGKSAEVIVITTNKGKVLSAYPKKTPQ